MAFGKPKLPLSHGEQLRKHMSIFAETLSNLESLELVVAEELTETEERAQSLTKDLSDVRASIARVKQVTG